MRRIETPFGTLLGNHICGHADDRGGSRARMRRDGAVGHAAGGCDGRGDGGVLPSVWAAETREMI